jgi:osmotically-inducible protein OsmY
MKRQTTQAAVLAMFLTVIAPAAFAAAPPTTDLTDTFRGAGAVVNSLQVYELAGIVIIRGSADKAQAEILSNYARSLGYQRVANLIQTVQTDDAGIARRAEVALAEHRSLEGCRFHLRSEQGVVHIGGQVVHELQKDVALQVLRGVDGVRKVEMNLVKF